MKTYTNSNIVDDRVQDANESAINAIYLKLLEYGKDSLTNEDSATIDAMAMQCPYVGGTAVYKARSLYAMYDPASMFDDIKLCNPIGVYKNSNGNNAKQVGLFDAENNYLRSLKLDSEKIMISDNELIVYPNPTNTVINIRYNEIKDTKLQVLNVLGVVVKEIFLSKNVQHVQTFIEDLSPGVYIYKQIVDTKILNTGKLIITN